jgi:hypothetical protein
VVSRCLNVNQAEHLIFRLLPDNHEQLTTDH